MAAHKKVGSRIRELLLTGESNRNIRRELSVSAATISYHARKLGLEKAPRPKYNWPDIQIDLNDGMTVRELRAKYGFCSQTYAKAIEKGRLVRPDEETPVVAMALEEILENIQGISANPYYRFLIRRKMVSEGHVERKCGECELTEWRGEKLSLDLDHIDGNRENNSLANLRLLCPNCHSITPTWRGRNGRKY